MHFLKNRINKAAILLRGIHSLHSVPCGRRFPTWQIGGDDTTMDTIGGSVAAAAVAAAAVVVGVGAADVVRPVDGAHHCLNSDDFHLPMDCYQQNVAAAGNWPHDPAWSRRDDAAQQPVVEGRGEGMITEVGRVRGTGVV